MVGCLCILEEAHADPCAILVPECAVPFEAALLLQLGQEFGFDRLLDNVLAYTNAGIATQVEIHETLPFQRHHPGAAGRQISRPGVPSQTATTFMRSSGRWLTREARAVDRRRLRAPSQDRAGYILPW